MWLLFWGWNVLHSPFWGVCAYSKAYLEKAWIYCIKSRQKPLFSPLLSKENIQKFGKQNIKLDICSFLKLIWANEHLVICTPHRLEFSLIERIGQGAICLLTCTSELSLLHAQFCAWERKGWSWLDDHSRCLNLAASCSLWGRENILFYSCPNSSFAWFLWRKILQEISPNITVFSHAKEKQLFVVCFRKHFTESFSAQTMTLKNHFTSNLIWKSPVFHTNALKMLGKGKGSPWQFLSSRVRL